jgi:hypothetical protein
MKIVRIQYNIEYIHILTFREEYKQAVVPYFSFDKLRYAIDNENTINESIRLIFTIEHLAVFIRKEGLTFIFEGDIGELKSQNGVIKVFWDLFQNIKGIKGFKRCTKHSLIINAVELVEKPLIDNILENNPYLPKNPFGKLTEFACIYEFLKDGIYYKYQFGNYSEKDITTYELRPFSTEYTKELLDGLGYMWRVELKEETKEPTFSKFKTLLNNSEQVISKFDI